MKNKVIYLSDAQIVNGSAGGVLQFTDRLGCGLSKLVNVDLCRSSGYQQAEYYAKFGRFLFEELAGRLASNGVNLDGLIFPNYYLPHALSKNALANSAVVVHDLQHRFYPQYFSGVKRRWLDYCLDRVARLAGIVVCISESTKNDFSRLYGRKNNVVVIKNGVPSSGYRSPSDDKYILASYHYYPHKNIQGVLMFFEKMVEAGYAGGLKISGGGREKVSELFSCLRYDTRQRISHVGFVEESDLRVLQAGADAFISLSEFEGFNLPAAECASLGVPLILSDIPVHRELFSDIAKYDGENNFTDIVGFIEINRKKVLPWSFREECSEHVFASRYASLF